MTNVFYEIKEALNVLKTFIYSLSLVGSTSAFSLCQLVSDLDIIEL